MHPRNRPIYQAYSTWASLKAILFRFACLGAVAYLCLHFNERPGLIAILTAIAAFFFVIAGEDVVRLYSDRLVFGSYSISSWLFGNKRRTYRLEDIRSAQRPAPPSEEAPGVLETGVILLLLSILPRSRPSTPTEPSLILHLHDGSERPIYTDLTEDQISELVELLNKHASG